MFKNEAGFDLSTIEIGKLYRVANLQPSKYIGRNFVYELESDLGNYNLKIFGHFDQFRYLFEDTPFFPLEKPVWGIFNSQSITGTRTAFLKICGMAAIANSAKTIMTIGYLTLHRPEDYIVLTRVGK